MAEKQNQGTFWVDSQKCIKKNKMSKIHERECDKNNT